jgi:hypothetical protein
LSSLGVFQTDQPPAKGWLQIHQSLNSQQIDISFLLPPFGKLCCRNVYVPSSSSANFKPKQVHLGSSAVGVQDFLMHFAVAFSSNSAEMQATNREKISNSCMINVK